jgi:hypothetical protein
MLYKKSFVYCVEPKYHEGNCKYIRPTTNNKYYFKKKHKKFNFYGQPLELCLKVIPYPIEEEIK